MRLSRTERPRRSVLRFLPYAIALSTWDWPFTYITPADEGCSGRACDSLGLPSARSSDAGGALLWDRAIGLRWRRRRRLCANGPDRSAAAASVAVFDPGRALSTAERNAPAARSGHADERGA